MVGDRIPPRAFLCYFPDGWLDVAPTVHTLLGILRQHRYDATVYAWGSPGTDARSSDLPIVRLSRVTDRPIPSFALNLVPRGRFPALGTLLDAAAYTVGVLRRSALLRRRPTVVIAVDRIGALAALATHRLLRIPYVWLSLELQSPTARLAGVVFGKAFRDAAAVITQDEARFRILCGHYGHEPRHVFFLPNAPAGPAPEPIGGSNMLRERLRIDEKRFPHIALHAGMIDDAFFSKELAGAFLPIHDFALVFHERFVRSSEDPYIRSVLEVNSSNLFLSLEPLPLEHVDRAFSSATVGLAFYRARSQRHEEIAMASGKLAYYLRNGKPVLTSDQPSLRKLVDEYRIGSVVGDPSDSTEIRRALDDILTNYAEYSRNARSCFEDVFDMDRNVRHIVDFLESLAAAQL